MYLRKVEGREWQTGVSASSGTANVPGSVLASP
jgi:hypothetical protein